MLTSKRQNAKVLSVVGAQVLMPRLVVSYDGKTGEKTHGEPLPSELRLRHLSIHAGRSSQSTLLGRDCHTVESLYLSPALVERLNAQTAQTAASEPDQQELAIA